MLDDPRSHPLRHLAFNVERCCTTAPSLCLLEHELLTHAGFVEVPVLGDDVRQAALEVLHDGCLVEVLSNLAQLLLPVRPRAVADALEYLSLLGREIVLEHTCFEPPQDLPFLVER